MTELTVWNFVNAINETKENLFLHPEAAKAYNSYIVNRHLSYFPDTVMYANEMNYYRDAPPERQFHYLRHAIRKRKRFTTWAKPIVTGEMTAVMDYFGLGPKKAQELLAMLSTEQISEIIKGGMEHATEGARHI